MIFGKNLMKKTKQWTKFVASSLPPPSGPGITWCWHFKKRKPIQWKFTWCRESEIWKFRLPRKKKFTGLLLEKTLLLHLHFSSTYFTNNRKSLRDVFILPDRKYMVRSEMLKWDHTLQVNLLVIAKSLQHYLGCTQFSVLFGCDCSNSSSQTISC